MVEFNHSPIVRIEGFEYQLRAIGERATELESVMEDIVIKIMDRERRMFETRGATSGRYWAPLKGSTVARKKRLAHVTDPFAPLRETDTLMKSLSERGAPGQILDITNDGFIFGTSIGYAQFHETGTTRGGKRTPARPPLVIPKKHAHEYVGMINDFIYGPGNA